MVCMSGKDWTDWYLLLPMLLFAYREAVHEATGFKPLHIVFGHDVRGPLDIVKEHGKGRKIYQCQWLNISLIFTSIWNIQQN